MRWRVVERAARAFAALQMFCRFERAGRPFYESAARVRWRVVERAARAFGGMPLFCRFERAGRPFYESAARVRLGS